MSKHTKLNVFLILAAVCFMITVCIPYMPWNVMFLIAGFLCLYGDYVFPTL